MNNHNITTILQELYEVDPSLRQHEQALTKAIMHLMESRSAITVDESFVRQLRSEILSQAHSMQPATSASQGWWASVMNMQKLSYGLGGAVIIALVVVSLQNSSNNPFELASRTSVTKVGNNAFGELVYDAGGRGGGGNVQEMARSYSAPSAAPSAGLAQDSVGSAKMIAPDIYPYQQFKYVYKGEELNLDKDTVEVLRRIRPGAQNSPSASILDRLSMGLLDIGKFQNLKVQSLALFEDRDYGYMLNFDMYEGFVSVNEYWNKWPQQYGDTYQPIKPAEVPADDEIIRIADEFVRQLNINTSNYGGPFVQNDWRVYLAAAPASERSSIMAPDSITVVYPLLVNGQETYEQGGAKSGFTVNVNIRHKRASGLWGLNTQQYESSNYAAETDEKEIIRLAEQGGFEGHYRIMEGSNVRTITAELGTPTMGYIRMWNYKGPNDSAELLVPALVFPITNKPAEMAYLNNVIIPLAKDLLKQTPGMGGDIMPLMKTQ